MKRMTTFLGLVAAALLAAAPPASAQTATVYGQLGNFDVVNNTGHDAHGFEVELVGVKAADVYYAFTYQRYGVPQYVDTPLGVRVRWAAPYAAGAFTATTVPHAPNTPFASTCYMGSQTYDAAGCEHFGVSLTVGSPKATYRWLVEDPQAPGTLMAVDPPIAVAQAYYYVAPPVAATPPVVVVEVQAPEPAEAPSLYGDAQWMKVFVTQLPREVQLDELITDNPLVVPMDPAQTEVNWDILQTQPVGTSGNSNGNRQSRGQKRYQGGLAPTTRSVVRRIELYNFTGAYSALNHEALCADLTCLAPAADELGDFISAQMTAVNVQADSVTVTKVGNGNVDSTDKRIACGGKCTSPYIGGTVVTLTAKAGSGSLFTGWTGVCGGVGICTVTATGAVGVSATFALAPATGGGGGGTGGGGGGSTATTYKISISKNGKGTVTADPSAASYAAGTVVTLTATPDPGSPWIGWGGACSGTAATCTVTMNANLSVTANFK